jgi:hypothetical protein
MVPLFFVMHRGGVARGKGMVSRGGYSDSRTRVCGGCAWDECAADITTRRSCGRKRGKLVADLPMRRGEDNARRTTQHDEGGGRGGKAMGGRQHSKRSDGGYKTGTTWQEGGGG